MWIQVTPRDDGSDDYELFPQDVTSEDAIDWSDSENAERVKGRVWYGSKAYSVELLVVPLVKLKMVFVNSSDVLGLDAD